MTRLSQKIMLSGLAGLATVVAQTQVDLRTQSRGVDFQAAPYTKPFRTAATLPATCSVNELLLLTTGISGASIYACTSPNVWVPQGGSQALAIQNGGSPVASRGAENFVSGLGINNIITDLGTKVNIQQGVDTAAIVSQAALQAGTAQYCQSRSGSAFAYTCGLSPTLTGYTQGMVLYWQPDVNGSGGATTLSIDLLGQVALVKADGTNPGAADILAGELYPVWYDGTAFHFLGSLAGAGSGGGGSSTPASIGATNAGGQTIVTASSEWHAPLAYCSGASASMLVWNVPPAGSTAATATGCAGTSVNDAFAGFGAAGTPSLQTSFMLPQTLTGTADVYISYNSPTAGGTFAAALDVVCTAASAASDDPPFVLNNFFASGSTTAPTGANTSGTLSATGLNWPAGCVAGSRAHVRLIRTDTTGTAASVNIAEATIVLRRRL